MVNYVCFTTIPPRFKFIERVAKSFLFEDHERFGIQVRIYIPFSYSRFDEEFESKIPKIENDNIKIIRVQQDYGPLTKMIGPIYDDTIKDNDNIFIVDDDTTRSKRWFIGMYLTLMKKSRQVIQLSNILKTRQIHGSSGYCFRKGRINKKKFMAYIKFVPKVNYFIDDDLLTVYFKLFKTPIFLITITNLRKRFFAQHVGLSRKTDREEMRDEFYWFIQDKFKRKIEWKNFI